MRQILRDALQDVQREGLRITAVSAFYRTPAMPEGSGPDFVNAAATLETDGDAEACLAALHRVEDRAGRRRDARWGPRVLDLDLIALGDRVLPDAATQAAWRDLAPEEQQRRAPDRLILPHPRMQDRAFVLVPLADIAPDWRHPLIGATVREMLAARPAAERAAIRRLDAREES